MHWVREPIEGILENAEIWVCVFDAENSQRFAEDNAMNLLACFVDPEILCELANADGVDPGDMFLNQFIPDNPSLKSGDIGEIISKILLEGWFDLPKFPGYRWRNKSHRNEPIQGPDLIGYVVNDPEKPSDDDVLILVETKTRSASVKSRIAAIALEDAIKHYISDLANSLLFLRSYLRTSGLEKEATILDRFTSPHNYGRYHKRIIPTVVHNQSSWDDDYWTELPGEYVSPDGYDPSEEVHFILVKIPNLPEFMDQICQAAAEKVNDD